MRVLWLPLLLAAEAVGPGESPPPGAVAIGPNGGSLARQPSAFLLLPPASPELASTAALASAAAAHLRIAPEALLLADGEGHAVASIEQAVAGGVVYGRQACEPGAASCERWMWPAHWAGDSVSVGLAGCGADESSPAEQQDQQPPAYSLETLSTSPRVFRVSSFLSPSELVEFNSLIASPELCTDAGQHPAYCEWQPSVGIHLV